MDFEKVLEFFRALHDERVEYVLVGAVGLTVHGIVRATQDVDLFVRPVEEKKNTLRLQDHADAENLKEQFGLRD